MVIEELYRFFKSKLSVIIVFIATVLGIFHTYDAIFYTGTSKIKLNLYHPAFATFLNGVTAKGRYRTYFLWIMPMLFILAYCGKYTIEKKKNLDLIYNIKIGRKKYFASKMKVAGIVAVIITLIPNLISIIMTSCFLYGKKEFMGMELWSRNEAGDFLYYSIKNPYLTYFAFLISNILVSILLALMCQSVIFILEDTRITMLLVTALWLGVYFGNDYSFIGNVMQPFVADNTLRTFALSYLTYIPMVLVWIFAAYFKVVKKGDRL